MQLPLVEIVVMTEKSHPVFAEALFSGNTDCLDRCAAGEFLPDTQGRRKYDQCSKKDG
jgi:hypothetical protein